MTKLDDLLPERGVNPIRQLIEQAMGPSLMVDGQARSILHVDGPTDVEKLKALTIDLTKVFMRYDDYPSPLALAALGEVVAFVVKSYKPGKDRNDMRKAFIGALDDALNNGWDYPEYRHDD